MPFETFVGRLKVKVTFDGHINKLARARISLHSQLFSLRSSSAV